MKESEAFLVRLAKKISSADNLAVNKLACAERLLYPPSLVEKDTFTDWQTFEICVILEGNSAR